MVIVGVPLAGDGLPGLVTHEFEGARSENVLFVPVRILVQSGFLVDIGEWIGERRKEGGRGEFEPEHDCARVRRFDLVHHRVEGLPGAGDTGRRTDDALPARGDIGGRQRRPIMKFHPVEDFEGVGFVVIGGPRHLGAEVADKIAGRRRAFRVDANEDAVERRGRVHRRKGRLAMTVEARRRVGGDQVGQRAAPLWRLLGSRRPCESERRSQNERAAYRHLHPYGPLARDLYLSSHNRARS